MHGWRCEASRRCHCASNDRRTTALAVARALEANEGIERVFYPALDSSPDKELCDRLLGGRGGGTLAFEVHGGKERASRFQDALRLIKAAASLGGTHSLLVHAASVTHTQLGPDELTAAGISEGFCRLSIGLEDADDLIADLEQALAAVGLVPKFEDALDTFELGPDLARQQVLDQLVDRGTLVTDPHHVLRDRHPYVCLLTQLQDRLTALDPLRDHVHGSDDLVDLAALPQLDADRVIA